MLWWRQEADVSEILSEVPTKASHKACVCMEPVDITGKGSWCPREDGASRIPVTRRMLAQAGSGEDLTGSPRAFVVDLLYGQEMLAQKESPLDSPCQRRSPQGTSLAC